MGQAINELKAMLLETRKLKSIGALLMWDEETFMPEGTGLVRADHVAYISTLTHKLQTGEAFRVCLEQLVDMETGQALEQGLSSDIQRMLYLAWKDYHDAVVLPVQFVEQLSRHQSLSQQVWARSRAENDYKTFAPYLDQMVKLKKQEAEYYGYTTTPYDSLLDKYEPGMTAACISDLFNRLRVPLVQLVKDIREKGEKIDTRPLTREFDLQKQMKWVQDIVGDIGFDMKRGRIDQSAHPFTTSFHPTDVRMTTRLDKRNFKLGFFAALHEAGHGLYEQGLVQEEYGTGLGEAISFGFHESQSRLWENMIGRSKGFWLHYFPMLQQRFKRSLQGVDLGQFYRMINTVKPSFIRVEADEVTYCLHIMLRFEIEKILIDQHLPVEELPRYWNDKMEEYLGIRPIEYKDGLMQDIHWSMGAFGYFPTYALGNLYAAPILNQARKDIHGLEGLIEAGQLLPLKEWLAENIHRSGRRYTPGEMIIKLTGEPFSVEPFLDYLREKYSEVYHLNR